MNMPTSLWLCAKWDTCRQGPMHMHRQKENTHRKCQGGRKVTQSFMSTKMRPAARKRVCQAFVHEAKQCICDGWHAEKQIHRVVAQLEVLVRKAEWSIVGWLMSPEITASLRAAGTSRRKMQGRQENTQTKAAMRNTRSLFWRGIIFGALRLALAASRRRRHIVAAMLNHQRSGAVVSVLGS